ncbi:SigE family RNA polymerase sigma factor [Micromonospora vinacea]|uniref:RNA polymerase sigma-70 factor (ECF subfamily) n=1 Tax=Micromonospora vinacea TaxID=709878 RepID=A0ABS0JWN5_9ACTN|nr:SigE family RNA polymerase sigma factor [Micromonospora vinacea]MBG6100783.1 RNA polymerase sigma-70 factor (ECF subfamily) [Micromonospora vinacea]WSZ76311.1 SigE family RNA polymerase sigma factor [Micromonospora sp. NBC_00860]WTA67219.1 SigE family RNA polymerase sigma factor [Micromonospora sp. NBC_00855]
MRVSTESRLDKPPPEDLARQAGRPSTDSVDFDQLYHAHFRSLTIQLAAYCGDLNQAQDLVQEAFCRAFARWAKVSRYDDPVAWVRRVAWNLATSRWRRLRTAQAYLRRQREEHVPGPGPDRVVLARALAALPPNHRRVVVLHHLADLSVTEIAQQEDVPEGTVKSWLHRGRAALAAQLAPRNEVTDHG